MKKSLLSRFSCGLIMLFIFGGGLSAAAQTISGTVFEDVNYGGGAGRPLSTATTSATASGYSGSIGRPGAIVELYDTNSGNFVGSTITNGAGLYTFSSGLTANTKYTVRVVNSSVASGRAGATSGLLPVQTFCTSNDAADANRVGGENPVVTDGPANVSGTNNITLNFQGLNPNPNTDNTQFVDNVEVLQGGTALGTNPIQNPSFEAGTLTDNSGTYQYNPIPASTFGWTFSSGSGIQTNGSAFGPPNTTAGTGAQGTRAAFIQGIGSLSQTFSLLVGTYTIRFAAANRAYGGQQAVRVSVNGTAVLASVTAVTSGYTVFTTGTFTVSNTQANFSTLTAQSVAPVATGTGATTGIDFGFNFDVVTNTNDNGQGSLRQFIQNANALGNAGLAQAGSYLNTAGTATALPAGQETSIFMIPGTAAVAGLRAGLASGLNGGSGANRWALLALSSQLDAITAANTALDASTQTVNVGDSNPGTVGLGGTGGQFPTVGTGKLAYSAFNRPEVEVYSLASLPSIVLVQSGATGSAVRGFSLHGAGGTSGALQVAGATGVVLENNLVGINPINIADPTATVAAGTGVIASAGVAGSAGTYGIQLNGATLGVVVRHNVIAFCNNSGIYIPVGGTAAGSDILIVGNELVQNGYRATGGDNITVGDGGNGTGPIRIVANLVRTANSDGLQFDIGRNAIGGRGYNVVRNNTFFDNGNGGASVARAQLEGAAILYLQRNGGNDRGANPDSIYFNIINKTQAGAIVVGYGQRGIIISQNSTYFNGTPFNSPTGGNLGIDLITSPLYTVNSGNPVGARDYGNGDGVTANTGSTTTEFGNQGINYPVFTLATATATASDQVVVRGYVGSAPGQSRFAGAKVEIFTANNVPANNNGNVVSGDNLSQPHGEGQTYLTTLTCDGSGNFSATITVLAKSAPLSGDAISGFLTATAYLPGLGTSEFGPNRPIIIAADVQAAITGNSPVLAGTPGQFVATFANPTLTGQVTADGVVVSIQLPPGLTGASVILSNGKVGTYNSTTGLVTVAGYTPASPGSLTSGESFTVTINYTQPAYGPVTATAAISTTTNEAGQTANNTATATNQTTPSIDIATAISGPTTATAGNQVAYVVTSTNINSSVYISPASGVSQRVSVPAGASNIYVTGNGVITGSIGVGYTVTWPTIPALASGQSVSQTVSFTAPATAGTLSLTATISSTVADAVVTNNAATINTTTTAPVGGQANVFALISARATSLAPGATGSFTIIQGNTGPNAATGVRTIVVLPPGLSGVTFPAGASYDAPTGVLTLPATASQAPGAANDKTYTISFTAPANGGVIPATVQVLSTSPDQVPADNEASALITVVATADLAVQITGPTIGTAGQPLTYTVTTSDNGPGSGFNLVQTASLPAGLPISGPLSTLLQINGATPTSVSGSVATFGSGATAFTYNQTTGLVTYPALASLAVGVTLQTTFTFLAPANGNLSLTISSGVVGSSADPVTANNGASQTTIITPTTDVQVTLTSAGQVAAGNRLSYGVTTTNNGPAIAPGVATTVSLPTGLPISGPNAVLINGQAPSSTSGTVATYPDGSTYDSSASSLTQGLITLPALTNLAPGGAASAQNTISYVLPDGFQGTLTSTATVKVTGISDFIPSNNTAIVQPFIVDSNGPANPGVTLTASAGSVTAGSPISLTATISAPGTAVTGLLQSVQLPAGLTSGSGTVNVTIGGSPAGASYDNLTGLLTLPPQLNLAAGASLTYVIDISQAPGTGPLVATANINTSEVDSNPANNVARTTVAITPASALVTTISGPANVAAGSTVSYLISAVNNGPTTTTGTVQTVTVPSGATNVVLNGVLLTSIPAGGVLTLPTPASLLPGVANTIVNTLSFTAPGAAGTSFTVPTNLSAGGPGTVAAASASQLTNVISPGPLARDVVNATLPAAGVTTLTPFGNTAAAPLPILPLSAVAQGVASLSSYTIQALPLASQGILYLNSGSANTPVTAGQVLSLTEAAQLRFQPAAGYAGNATFPYFAIDNAGTLSNVALYLIPVGPDRSSVYTVLPTKGGATPYLNNDVLAYVIDDNGARYTNGGASPGLVYGTTGTLQPGAVNGLLTTGTGAVRPVGSGGPASNPTNALPPGVAFDPNTGLFTVSNRTLLPKSGGTFQINVITTDLYAGTNTVTVTLVLGSSPLPVQLTAFTATASGTSAQLKWTTASEVNNDYFDVERSLDGVSFGKIGRAAGQGSKVTATDYAFPDTDAARFANGGLVYYRLRQVDLDGTATYSPVRVLSFAAPAGSPTVYPNPVASATNPTLDLRSLPQGGTYRVLVLDLAGRQVRSATAIGGQAQPLDLYELASGTYLLRVSDTNGQPVLNQRLTKE